MKDYQERSRRAFDAQAADYDTAVYGAHARTLYPVLLAQMGQIPHRQVLDVGCGTGELLCRVLERWPETSCAGLDLSENMLEVARRKLGGRAELAAGDAKALPFASGRFDVVVCSDSFHHYPEAEAAVGEFHRVLAPGGVLLLADTTAPAGARQLVNLFLPLSREGDFHLYGTGELVALLGRWFHGVECRRINATSFLAWGVR